MARYDRVDETVLHAPPEAVWEALEHEFCGKTHWWLPELGFRPLEGTRTIVPGAAVEVVPAAGRIGQHRSPFAFVSRAVDVVENERLGTEYVAGAFRGIGEWTLEPAGEGTRLRMHWRVRTSGRLATLVAMLLDLGEQHSKAMQAGFARLSACLGAGVTSQEHGQRHHEHRDARADGLGDSGRSQVRSGDSAARCSSRSTSQSQGEAHSDRQIIPIGETPLVAANRTPRSGRLWCRRPRSYRLGFGTALTTMR